MNEDDFRLFLIIFLFTLTFCGQPDLHDALISNFSKKSHTTEKQEITQKERE